MRLTVLGRYAPYNPAGGACSGYLVESGSTRVLIDGGNGVLGRLQSYIAPGELNGVVVSHLHPDHTADLHALRYWIMGALQNGLRTGSLPMWAPTEPAADRAWLETDRWVELKPLPDASGLTIGDLTFTFCRTQHPIPCFAMRVSGGGRTLFYSADSGWSEDLLAFAAGADVALVEASLLEADGDKRSFGHLSAGEAARFGRAAGVGRLLLTHLWPGYAPENLLREARGEWSRAELAEENQVYSW